jgi:hypothetical protein
MGEIPFAYGFLDLWWDIKMKDMNEKEDGRKYRYPDSLILVIGYIGVIFIYHADIQTNRGNHKSNCKGPAKPPQLLTINRRVNNL